MAARPDLAALLADPARAVEVPVETRQALLDELAVHEGRCRLVRDLLTVSLARCGLQLETPPDSEPYTLEQVTTKLQKSRAWTRRRAKRGEIPGAHKVGRSWVFDRPPFERWRRRPEVG